MIEFEVNGDRVQYIGAEKTYRFSNGKVVIIRYDPKQPDQAARVVKPFDRWAPLTVMALGGVCFVLGAKKVVPFRLN